MRYYVKVMEREDRLGEDNFPTKFEIGIQLNDGIECGLALLSLNTVGPDKDKFLRDFRFFDSITEEALAWATRAEVRLVADGFNPSIFQSGLWPKDKFIMEF